MAFGRQLSVQAHRPGVSGSRYPWWRRVGQGPDYWGNDLFDDTYSHNGKFQKYHGYATDVFFENALSFIEKNQQQPFFLYISTNAPHKPLHVPEKYYNLYKDEEQLPETQKRFYGMKIGRAHV